MHFIEQYKFVTLDFETTGNRIKEGDQIIQVGLCVLEKGQITQRFSSFVKPTISIPPFIEQLTEIGQEDVSHAPSIEEVLPQVLPLLDGAWLVAHNIHFDLSFLQHTLQENGYSPFRGKILDTVELSRILYPDMDGYRLSQLASVFDMEHDQPHQADSDAWATAQLFLRLCKKAWELPLLTLQRMIPLSSVMRSDVETLFRLIEGEKLLHPQQLPRNYEIEQAFVLARQEELALAKADGEDSPEDTLFASADLAHMLAQALPRYEQREGQASFYEQIMECFRSERHGLFEVGTGTGKTLAYLYAAILWSRQRQEKVIISTYTIQLQEQVIKKELPLLRKVLPFPVQVALLKGRHHYLCLRKLDARLKYGVERNYGHHLTLMQILVWLTETTTGDVDELNLPSGGKELWKFLHSDRSCNPGECPSYHKCFYTRARKAANEAQVIVTNHALLLTDQRYGHSLPAYDYAILDEAHHFQPLTVEQHGIELREIHVHSIMQRFVSDEKQNLIQRLTEVVQLWDSDEQFLPLVYKVGQSMARWKEDFDLFIAACYQFASEKKPSTEGATKQIRYQHHLEKGDKWKEVLFQADLLYVGGKDIVTILNKLRQLRGKRTFTGQELHVLQEWDQTAQEFDDVLEQVQALFLQADPLDNVYWMEYTKLGDRHGFAVCQQPLAVDQLLGNQFFRQKKSVVLTSATLQINGTFSYIENELGLTDLKPFKLVISSPFDYAGQCRLFIAKDSSAYHLEREVSFAEQLSDSLYQIAVVTKGRMLVLFTSYRMMLQAYELMKERVQQAGLVLIVQGVDSGSRTKLIKNFHQHDQAILFGTNSFWEGIDIPGQTLSCLVIVKLPFLPPTSPYFEAKSEQLLARGENPFTAYALPQAVLRFKQGFGRLIRSSSDRGVVVVFDRRLQTAAYGNVFLRSLPPLDVQAVGMDQMLTEIQAWLG